MKPQQDRHSHVTPRPRRVTCLSPEIQHSLHKLLIRASYGGLGYSTTVIGAVIDGVPASLQTLMGLSTLREYGLIELQTDWLGVRAAVLTEAGSDQLAMWDLDDFGPVEKAVA